MARFIRGIEKQAMNCEQAAEFISALLDGEKISGEAAEHIGNCTACGVRMREYACMSAELKREASAHRLYTAEVVRPVWEETSERKPFRRWNWGASVRIPTLVFGLMVIAIIALVAGGIAIVRARTMATESVLLLTADLPRFNHAQHCVLRLDETRAVEPCSFASYSTDVPGAIFATFRFVRREESGMVLAFKAKYVGSEEAGRGGHMFDAREIETIQEQEFLLSPSKPTQVSVSGLGEIILNGEFLDHVPVLPSRPKESLDPQSDELRIVSPLLIRDKQMIFNLEGFVSISSGNNNSSVMLYAPGFGRYLISVEPSPGAIQAKVNMNQIEFVEDGHKLLIANGMPVTRSEYVWLLHEPNFKLSGSDEHAAAASGSLKELLRIGKEKR
jgi:hypothetical protein